ncbi:EpsG family protein [Arcobacter aquimarinus]|uniref:EpsG family protein n=1 Tax=Arcobacter aquimarinus TaxID=1315211 RepID=UPI003BAF9C3F
MYIYVIPYILILFVGVLTLFSKFSLNSARLIFLFFLLPVFFLVIFRGNIGVDTEVYESIIDYYILTGECRVEPLFCFISEPIYSLVNRSDFTLRVITAIFCILFYFAFSKTKNDIVVASLFIFPVFFYDMSTNGIRYGLAFILFKLLFDGLTKKSILTIPIYISIQSSSLLLVILSFINKINLKKIALIVLILAPIFYLLIGGTYLTQRIEAYSGNPSPNLYSGILNFLLGFLIISTLRYFRRILLKEFLIYFTILLSFQILSYFTYAGLRLVQLMLFYFAIRSIPLINISNLKSNIIICFILFITGFIYFLNLLRVMSVEHYLPYQFIF